MHLNNFNEGSTLEKDYFRVCMCVRLYMNLALYFEVFFSFIFPYDI